MLHPDSTTTSIGHNSEPLTISYKIFLQINTWLVLDCDISKLTHIRNLIEFAAHYWLAQQQKSIIGRITYLISNQFNVFRILDHKCRPDYFIIDHLRILAIYNFYVTHYIVSLKQTIFWTTNKYFIGRIVFKNQPIKIVDKSLFDLTISYLTLWIYG